MAWTVIIKNNSGSTQVLEDFGVELLNGTQLDFTNYFAYDEIGGSRELKDKVTSGDLIVNDGTNDLSAEDGVNHITLENIKNVSDEHYTKTELQTAGSATVHWDNIINAPSFGSPTWDDPVKYRVLDITNTAPATPSTGDVYVNTGDNHYYKWDGSAWQDEGSAVTDDRVINLANADQDIYTFDGANWNDQGLTNDNVAVMLNDDGDGKNAQYVFQAEDNTWRKISDVDFASHFDGGPSKHDASEIDVEGTYTNLPSTPTDLETTIADINTQLTEALDNNTLDGAYDEGSSPGAGRQINADAGAVVIDTGVATNAPLELVPKSSLPTTGLNDGQLAIRDGILCVYDAVRAKWLSVQRQFLIFGRRRRVRNQYLNFCVGNLPSKNSGFRLVRDACIVSMSGHLDSNGSCDIHIRRNDLSTNILSLNISSALGASNASANVDLNADDFLQCYLQASSDVEDPVSIIEIAWRL